MAQDKAALAALINSNLPDNTTGQITPQKHREVSTQVMDSAVNTVETGAQSVAGPVDFTGGITKSGQDLLTAVNEVDIIRAYSLAASQVPAGIGTPLQVEFGVAQSTPRLSLSAAGDITCNITGTYSFRFKLQKGRVGASGTSILMSRLLINGVQAGISSAARMTTPEPIYIIDSKVTLQLTAGDVVTLQIIRDGAGSDFGGLYAVTSSHGWTLAPTVLFVGSYLEGA